MQEYDINDVVPYKMNNDMYIANFHTDTWQLNNYNNTSTISIIIVNTIDSNFSIIYGVKLLCLPNKIES